MQTVSVLLLSLAAFAARAWAEDAGAIMAAFADPEAECRYMAMLCQEALSARGPYEDSYKKAHAAESQARALLEAWQKDLMNDKKDHAFHQAKETAEKARGPYETARARWLKPHNDTVSALKVLAAKRGNVPSCVSSECVQEAQRVD
jgi:hypothetical protein